MQYILRYVKQTLGRGLFFTKKDDLIVHAFIDADWTDSITNQKSTSGYCTFVRGNLVTRRSEKQSVAARSSVEAKFRAWSVQINLDKRVLNELRMPYDDVMQLYCHNQSTIIIAHNPIHHD